MENKKSNVDGNIERDIEHEEKLNEEEFIKIAQKSLADWRVRRKRRRLRAENIKVQRIDLSLELSLLFCQNAKYEMTQFISDGINLHQETVLKFAKEEFEQLQAASTSSNSNLKQRKKKPNSKNKKFKKPKPVQASSLQATNQPVTAKSNNPKQKDGNSKIKNSRMYPLLLKKSEETGGYPQQGDYDELEAEGELARKQIADWFGDQRRRLGFQ